jgi:hypothetical protein
VLSLLVMYVITNLAAARHLHRTGRGREAVLPVIGLAIALYVLYRNVWPVPDFPFDLFPYIVAAWLVAGAIWASASTKTSEKVGNG